jgi:hypothetical protein
MNRERRGRTQENFGRAIACVLGSSTDRLATAAVLLAIVVSLAGACVVILETSSERPVTKHLTIATAE